MKLVKGDGSCSSYCRVVCRRRCDAPESGTEYRCW